MKSQSGPPAVVAAGTAGRISMAKATPVGERQQITRGSRGRMPPKMPQNDTQGALSGRA